MCDPATCRNSKHAYAQYHHVETRDFARRRPGGQSIRAGLSRWTPEKGGPPTKRRWKALRASRLGIAREFRLMQATLNTPFQGSLTLSHAISCLAQARGTEYSRGVKRVASKQMADSWRLALTRGQTSKWRHAARSDRRTPLILAPYPPRVEHARSSWVRSASPLSAPRPPLATLARNNQLAHFSRFAGRLGRPSVPCDDIPKSQLVETLLRTASNPTWQDYHGHFGGKDSVSTV